MDLLPFIVLGILAIAVVAYLAWLWEKKRREAIAAWARANGWRFDPEKRGAPGYPFGLFNQGHSRYSRFHLTKSLAEATAGIDTADVDLFEYHYAVTTGSGKDRRTQHYHFTCAYVEPGLDLGGVMIRKEGWGDKIVQAIGFDDIDFEDPEFSKRFVVKAKNRKEAYDLLDGRMMEWLLAHRGPKIETEGRCLLVQESGRAKPERFAALARFVEGFLGEIPRVKVNEERSERGLPPLTLAGNVARFQGGGDGGESE